ncbi:MAG: heavy-metal-associated domain-containing protein [Planctomycetes bacterium]|nr:heavy-metal-associated domain-containing protein [Planctomycetota bacterium]
MKSLTTITAALVLVTGCQNDQGTSPEASTVVETTPAVFNAAGAPTASLHVPGMYCEFSCVEKVKQVLADQAGVKEVVVDFKSKTVTVAIDQSAFNAEGAVAALVDYQFMDSELITDEGEALASGASTKTEATTVKVSYEK